jgi:hypothetical protein
VPSRAFRAKVLADSPELAPIVSGYPLGQAPTSDPDTDQFVSKGTQVVNENSAMVRLDQHFSEKTTAYVRFNFDRAVNTQPLASSGNYLGDLQQLTSAPVNGAIELLHISNPNLVNEFKAGFNRGTANTYDINHTSSPYAVSVSGFTTLNNNRISKGVGNSFSWIDNLTWIERRHTLKAGVEIRRIQLNQGNTQSGTITYASTDAFDTNSVSSATLNGTLPVNGLRKTQFYGYIQDEFKWTSNFNLNLGVRYSFFNIFHEVLGRANPFDFATCGPQGFCGIGASFGRAPGAQCRNTRSMEKSRYQQERTETNSTPGLSVEAQAWSSLSRSMRTATFYIRRRRGLSSRRVQHLRGSANAPTEKSRFYSIATGNPSPDEPLRSKSRLFCYSQFNPLRGRYVQSHARVTDENSCSRNCCLAAWAHSRFLRFDPRWVSHKPLSPASKICNESGPRMEIHSSSRRLFFLK